MPRPLDLSGKRFSRLTAVRFVGHDYKKRRTWFCVCDCGESKVVPAALLTGGKTSSCGCRARELHAVGANRKHGLARTKEWYAWHEIKRRCFNSSRPEWKNYGGRGIRIHDAWANSFEAFLDHIGPAPSASHSIDRIDNNGSYEPGNVRWATRKQQNQNTRSNILIDIGGERWVLSEAARYFGIRPRLAMQRISRGWTPERALTERPGQGGCNERTK